MNIVDIYASIIDEKGDQPTFKPTGIEPDQLLAIVNDCKSLLNIADKSKGKAMTFSEMVISQEKDPQKAIIRLNRLMPKYDPKEIEDAMKAVCGGSIVQFCEDFALACQLEYFLRFRESIERSIEKIKNESNLAIIVISILKRLVDSYQPVIETWGKQLCGTGLQFSALNRDERVTESIIELLLKQLPRGLQWVEDEVTAFPCLI